MTRALIERSTIRVIDPKSPSGCVDHSAVVRVGNARHGGRPRRRTTAAGARNVFLKLGSHGSAAVMMRDGFIDAKSCFVHVLAWLPGCAHAAKHARVALLIRDSSKESLLRTRIGNTDGLAGLLGSRSNSRIGLRSEGACEEPQRVKELAVFATRRVIRKLHFEVRDETLQDFAGSQGNDLDTRRQGPDHGRRLKSAPLKSFVSQSLLEIGESRLTCRIPRRAPHSQTAWT